MDHALDLAARFVVLGHQGGPFRHERFLPVLEGLVFLAKGANLIQQLAQLAFEPLKVGVCLFECITAFPSMQMVRPALPAHWF